MARWILAFPSGSWGAVRPSRKPLGQTRHSSGAEIQKSCLHPTCLLFAACSRRACPVYNDRIELNRDDTTWVSAGRRSACSQVAVMSYQGCTVHASSAHELVKGSHGGWQSYLCHYSGGEGAGGGPSHIKTTSMASLRRVGSARDIRAFGATTDNRVVIPPPQPPPEPKFRAST